MPTARYPPPKSGSPKIRPITPTNTNLTNRSPHHPSLTVTMAVSISRAAAAASMVSARTLRLSCSQSTLTPAARVSLQFPRKAPRHTTHCRPRMLTSNNSSKPPSTSPSSSAMIQNLAIFAVAGTLGYGAVHLFNSSGDGGADAPVSPSAPITSRVYFDVTIQNQPAGRVVIGLYGSTTPKTVNNFETLCRGTSSSNGQQLG